MFGCALVLLVIILMCDSNHPYLQKLVSSMITLYLALLYV